MNFTDWLKSLSQEDRTRFIQQYGRDPKKWQDEWRKSRGLTPQPQTIYKSGKYGAGTKYETDQYSAPALYLTDASGAVQTNAKGKPILNQVYNTSKFQDAMAGVAIGNQVAGQSQDQFFRLGAIAGGAIAGLFSGDLAGYQLHMQAQQMAQEENKQNLAVTQAGARLDFQQARTQQVINKTALETETTEIRNQGIKLNNIEKAFGIHSSGISRLEVQLNSGTLDDGSKSLIAAELIRRKRNFLADVYKIDETKFSDEQINGFSPTMFAKVGLQNYGDINLIVDTETKAVIGIQKTKDGAVVPSSSYAEEFKTSAASVYKVDPKVISDNWAKASEFVRGDKTLQGILNKFTGDARDRQEFTMIKKHFDLLMSNPDINDPQTFRGFYEFVDMNNGRTETNPKSVITGLFPTPTTSSVNPANNQPGQSTVIKRPLASPLGFNFVPEDTDINSDGAQNIQLMSEFTKEGDDALNSAINNPSTNQNDKAVYVDLKRRKEFFRNKYKTPPKFDLSRTYSKDKDLLADSGKASDYMEWFETIMGGYIPPSRDEVPKDKLPYYDAYIAAGEFRNSSANSFMASHSILKSDYTINGSQVYYPIDSKINLAGRGGIGTALMVMPKPLSTLKSSGQEEYITLNDQGRTLFQDSYQAFTKPDERLKILIDAFHGDEALAKAQLKKEQDFWKGLSTTGSALQSIPGDSQGRYWYFVVGGTGNNAFLKGIYLAKIPKATAK